MSASFIFFLLIAGTFLLAYFSKRRFGVLGLALAAGALISEQWAGTVTPFLETQGLQMVAPPLGVSVAIALTLLPAIVLLLSGPSYNKGFERIIGAVLFTVLAFAFVAPQIGPELVFDNIGLVLYDTMQDYRPLIIVVGLTVAVVDVFLTRSPKKPRNKKGEH